MSASSAELSQWLDRLRRLHPSEIELGLARVRSVAQRLALDLTPCQVVTVAGTNGKGSTIAALQAIALRHGWSVASYTSPHLLRFNERIQIDGQPVDDALLCYAFEAVENERGGVPLTFFEFTTLAALHCFAQYRPHLCLLEVGLGGRLDAVNIIDADIALVTNIQLDHQQLLGPDRETIALEKAGIFRPGKPAVCAEHQPPSNLRRAAREIGAHWLQAGRDFDLQHAAHGWHWHGVDSAGAAINIAGRAGLSLTPQAVAGAIQAACLLLPEPEPALVADAAVTAQLPGRRQFVDVDGREVVLDVAHNAAAVALLVQTLARRPARGRTHLVLALLQDKPADDIIAGLAPAISGRWCLPALAAERARSTTSLAERVTAQAPVVFDSVAAALAAILVQAAPDDRVVVTGSFYTVAEAMQMLRTRGVYVE